MAEFTQINISADTWTLLSTTSTEFQVISRQHVYYTESEALPVGGEDAVYYKIAAPRALYRFNKKPDTNLYVYSAGVPAIVTMGVNDDSILLSDQYTEIIDLRLSQEIDEIVLQGNYNINDTQIIFTCDTLPVIGDIVCLKEDKAFYQGEILTVAGTNPYTVDLDTPLDYAFTVAGGCSIRSDNMAVDGSVTPQEFILSPRRLTVGVKWDIVRVMFTITDQTAMDDEKFGGIPKLTRGIVFRHTNNITKNVFNVKNNGEFALHSFDAVYSDKAPAGYYGFRVRRTFGGMHKNGVVIRLESRAVNSDLVEIIIQDDLTDLDSFRAVLQGHVTLD